MADELVRVKIENEGGQGVPNTLMKIFSADGTVLEAQGLTSKGPTPALGVFETVLPGSAAPGILYTIHAQTPTPIRTSRSQIRVIT